MTTNQIPETQIGGEPVSRRSFIRYLLGFSIVGTLAGVLTPIIGYLWPPKTVVTGVGGRVEVGPVADFPVEQGQVLAINDKPVMVVNTTQGGIKAYSAICTHLGCVTEWDQAKQVIRCPCHDGRFNPVNGAIISGPVPSPLPQLDVTIDGGIVYINEA